MLRGRTPTGLLALGWLAALAALPQSFGRPAAAAAQEPERLDLLSWAAGAFTVRLEEPATPEASRSALDGDPRTVSIGIPRRQPLPHRFVVELPAPTTFEAFAVPAINEFGSAHGAHVKTVVIEGSSEGPDVGFQPLATLALEMDRNAPQEVAVADARPVRWVRVQLVDRMQEPPNDVSPYMFSELMGYGTQEPVASGGDRYTGRWRIRRTGIRDEPGNNVIELTQGRHRHPGMPDPGGAADHRHR